MPAPFGFFRDQKGSVVLLVSLAMVGLVGMAAISLDAGNLYAQRQKFKNITDAAALAGAQLLIDNDDATKAAAEAQARAVAGFNGLDPSEVSVNLEDNRIRVSAGREEPVAFGRVFGFEQVRVEARSTAINGVLKGVRGARPFGVELTDLAYGELYTLKWSALGGNPPSGFRGNFHALALGGTGADLYEQNIMYGANVTVRVGEYVTTEPGAMVGSTRRATDYVLASDPVSTYDNILAGSLRVMYLPLVQTFSVSGRTDIQVVGLAAFFLEDSPRPGELRGRFLRMSVDGEVDESGTVTDYGARAVKLVE